MSIPSFILFCAIVNLSKDCSAWNHCRPFLYENYYLNSSFVYIQFGLPLCCCCELSDRQLTYSTLLRMSEYVADIYVILFSYCFCSSCAHKDRAQYFRMFAFNRVWTSPTHIYLHSYAYDMRVLFVLYMRSCLAAYSALVHNCNMHAFV